MQIYETLNGQKYIRNHLTSSNKIEINVIIIHIL